MGNNTKDTINITVTGAPASGKSRILYAIKYILKEEGFNVEHKLNQDFNNEAEFDKCMETNIDKILEDIFNTKTIVIDEISTNKKV